MVLLPPTTQRILYRKSAPVKSPPLVSDSPWAFNRLATAGEIRDAWWTSEARTVQIFVFGIAVLMVKLSFDQWLRNNPLRLSVLACI
jgi:hypothetical protein